MSREEQILNKAIDYSEIEENFLEYDDCGDVCDDKYFVEKAFISGAKWADEHPNLYNDEKYHTVKVSCLDELNRKAKLYDVFLEKTCEWMRKQMCQEYSGGPLERVIPDFIITDYKKTMGEHVSN